MRRRKEAAGFRGGDGGGDTGDAGLAVDSACVWASHPKTIVQNEAWSGCPQRLPRSEGGRIIDPLMKSRIPLLVLVVVSLALLVALLATRREASEQVAAKDEIILDHSNNLQTTSIALDQVRGEKTRLEKELATLTTNYVSLSNSYQTTTGALATTESTLAQTKSTLDQVQSALDLAESKINDLEGQNQELDRKTTDLNASLTTLTLQIEETRRQLSMAEGDKALLQAELEKLMADKAELERQLNDLEVLKTQIRKLKSELAISRRLDWIRRGILGADDMKGATRQMNTARESIESAEKKSREPNYDLNVEILEDGSVRVLTPGTNAPAAGDSGQ